MNKKFYFGLAATAALFASCSSDDLSVNEARQDVLNGDNRAAIELLVGNPGSTTRGTGTVGGMKENDPNNKWGGQSFQVYMLDKGALTVAVDAESNPIYKGTLFTAPNELNPLVPANQPAVEVTTTSDGGLVINSNVKYFPQEGNYDFWAYRMDDAPNTVDENTMTTAFTIDGSQDIMVAKAVPNKSKNEDGTYGSDPNKVPESRIFSAYSVRRDVKPMLNFEHLLARIAFRVKGSEDLSDKSADPEAADPVIKANQYAVKVTGIELESMNKGTLTIAYVGDRPANLIAWDENSKTDLALKQRTSGYTSLAELEWTHPSVGFGYNQEFPSHATVEFNENSLVFDEIPDYSTNPELFDAAGLPLGGTRAGDIASGLNTKWIYRVKNVPVLGDISVNAPLTDLQPKAPIWNTTVSEEHPNGYAYATPIGEALLVAPQDSYKLTLHTSQKVVTKQTTKHNCTVANDFGDPWGTYYFYDAADKDEAVTAFAAATTDEDKLEALRKGTTTEGGSVTYATDWTTKTDTKSITLRGNSTQVGNEISYATFKANKSYTVTLTLAGMESITGGADNITIGGYEVDEGEGEIDINMDSEPSYTDPSNP